MAARLLWLILVVGMPADLAATPAPTVSRAAGNTAVGAPGSLAALVDAAIERGSRWLATYSQGLRFDAAVIVSQIRLRVDNPDLKLAFARAQVRGDHDHDHPHRRFWVPGFRSPPEHTSQWTVPLEGERRINTNRVLSEALHCAENGWRAATEAYICGPMRDHAGYHTTHGIWALDIAIRAGCATGATCMPSLRAELATAQPDPFEPKATLDIDLYAERVLMLLRTGTPASEADAWIEALLARQEAGGSWGVGEDPDPYYRYHATGMTLWALAEWRAAS